LWSIARSFYKKTKKEKIDMNINSILLAIAIFLAIATGVVFYLPRKK